VTVDQRLAKLAEAHGVATWYGDSDRRRVEVDPQVVIDVLGLLGVDAAAEAPAPAAGRLPPTIVLTRGDRRDLPGSGEIECEDGSTLLVPDGLPSDLPLGWHRLTCAGQTATLVVVPRALPRAPSSWGWMLQLYALRSASSWGVGDLGDLAAFTRQAGAADCGFVLLNPLHAVAPTVPVQASPYSPSSRRFINPLYLSVSGTNAYREAVPAIRKRVDALRPDEAKPGAYIDYDTAWTAKLRALELLFPFATAAADDDDVIAFATYCAIAELHGPNWRAWPEPLRTAGSTAVAEVRQTLAQRVAFYAWLQQLCEEQLAAVTEAAAGVGMSIGIVHDLAVGVDPGGADAWMLADVIADGVRIGAPPDAFNQLGQDWGLAAWHPQRLAESGYTAYRDLLRRALRNAGGLRVDHVAGLWRLWWIPPSSDAAHGTYVSYDAEAMLGILTLEAYRAGAVVIGEDLGTVSAAVTEGLQQRNMLGSTVLWFARGDADATEPPAFTPPQQWPANALASISTHDLPTAYGYLVGEHVRIRAELGLLAHDTATEQATADSDRRLLLEMLAERPAAEDHEIVVRMHQALVDSPSRLVAASLYDVLGEVRQPNLPGTTDEYPNWRLPLPVLVEDVFTDPRVIEISRLLAAGRPRS
jgi:4-alpha-glucanotransferase